MHIQAEIRQEWVWALAGHLILWGRYTQLGLNGVALPAQRVRVLRQVKLNSLHRHKIPT
jgi:hypothetical protein